MQTYLVGGAVRDQLLGRPVLEKDWVVTGASPDDLLSQGYQQVGKDFPVFLHPETKDEYALARTERKNGKGYTGFSCEAGPEITLEQDLCRRDLTVNAIAMAEDGTLVDPYGGQQDIESKVLRHVSDAFTEDPLRVLRVARFAARYHHLGFSIAAETLTLMREIVASGELAALSPERVWKETSRSIMDRDAPVYFETLRACGALAVWFPELDTLWGIPNPEKWHPEIDTGVHTMMVLEQACKISDSLDVRFAALVHDLGKGLTEPAKWPSHHGHEALGLAAIKALSERLRVPNSCRDLALLVSEFHSHVHRAFELRATTLLNVFDRCDAWRKPERFAQVLETCRADAAGRLHFEDKPYPQADYVMEAYEAAMAVDVKSILDAGFKGAQIKEQLHAQRVIAIKKIKNELPE